MESNNPLAHSVIVELKDEGIRITKLRRTIIEILAENKRPFSKVEIERFLKKRKILPHRTSLYRELEYLSSIDVLTPILFNDSSLHYELTDHGHHHHVICTNCHEVADVDLVRELHNEERRIEAATHFTVTHHSLEFFGLCSACSSASQLS